MIASIYLKIYLYIYTNAMVITHNIIYHIIQYKQ